MEMLAMFWVCLQFIQINYGSYIVQLTGLYRGCLCTKEPYYLYIKKAKALQVDCTKNIQDD